VADVGPRVHVVNRSSDVELCAFFHSDQIRGTATLGCFESLRRLAIAATDAMKTRNSSSYGVLCAASN